MKIKIAEPYITDDEVGELIATLKSGYLAYGSKCRLFEERFADYVGVKYAVATVNGTSALHTALLALGIGAGDEVITTPFSFIASSNAILYVGARPVFVDIDPETYNLDPNELAEKITNRTKAILVVHLYGHPCEMDPILEIARDHKLFVIEDTAQAHGAEYKGRKVGSFGDVAAFSFYATKNMTTGEGGMLVTNDKNVAEKARLIINHGQLSKYEHVMLGYNYLFNDILASLGLVQLKKLDMLNEIRIRNAEYYNERLSRVSAIKVPRRRPYVKHVYNQYVIWAEERNSLMKHLLNRGIEVAVHYPKPLYKQSPYVELGYGDLKLNNVEEACKHVLSIPVHPKLQREELDYIARSIEEFYNRGD